MKVNSSKENTFYILAGLFTVNCKLVNHKRKRHSSSVKTHIRIGECDSMVVESDSEAKY